MTNLVPTARDVLNVKGSKTIVTADGSLSVREACKLMRGYRIGCLVITDSKGRVEGVFTERDVVNRLVAEDKDAGATKVSETMTRQVIVVEPERPIDEVEAIMKQNRIRHMPIAGKEALVGLLSIGDLVAYHATESKQMVNYLTEYIYGR